jgi:hypothetical protein
MHAVPAVQAVVDPETVGEGAKEMVDEMQLGDPVPDIVAGALAEIPLVFVNGLSHSHPFGCQVIRHALTRFHGRTLSVFPHHRRHVFKASRVPT